MPQNKNRHESCCANSVRGFPNAKSWVARLAMLLAIASGGCAEVAGVAPDRAAIASNEKLRDIGPNTSTIDHPPAINLDYARAERALARCDKAIPGGHPHVSLSIVPLDRPVAFSRSDGWITLSRGLIAMLSDDELLGVVCHEMGHLLPRPQTAAVGFPNAAAATGEGPGPASIYALGGAGLAEECRADAIATRLLGRCGVPARTLACMLQKVRDDARTIPALRSSLTARMALIRED